MALKWRFELILVALIVATVGLRFVIPTRILDPDDRTVLTRVADFAERHGYKANGIAELSSRETLLIASGDKCLVYVSVAGIYGETDSAAQLTLGAGQTLHYVYGGRLIDGERPHLVPLIARYLGRLSASVGLANSFPYTLRVVTAGDCDVTGLPWADAPTVPYRAS